MFLCSNTNTDTLLVALRIYKTSVYSEVVQKTVLPVTSKNSRWIKLCLYFQGRGLSLSLYTMLISYCCNSCVASRRTLLNQEVCCHL